MNKTYSIIGGMIAYLIISHLFHTLFRDRSDIALGITYVCNDVLYIVGYICTFMFYGGSKVNRILFIILSIMFLAIFIYNWWIVSCMPYERFLYIGLGLIIYICEDKLLNYLSKESS